MSLPIRVTRRRVSANQVDLFKYERALGRSGFTTIAGVDEAGRGAAAGPLTVAAVVLKRPVPELADSKVLSAPTRERVYERVIRAAQAWSVVIISPREIDRIGLHVANIEGMRRALARLDCEPDYVLSDGFAVPGTRVPNLGMWKGDQVCGSVSAAGVIAKVTRDRIMSSLDADYPDYGFGIHKGYLTAMHSQTLAEYGPAEVHRYCFEPVRKAAQRCVGEVV